jgi:hypothetical protein
MRGYWEFQSRRGTFRIVPRQGRFHACYEDESLGSYYSPHQALDDLAGGHTFSPSNGIDSSTCGLPDDLAEWEFVRLAP